ncbi:hypothetical protein CORC01_04842 [Colletotrichum orchidophilum]|uniref:Uncharacterized protein n=1 Tax=Colletotrichum orchidophilum TaxID=1209926 RepID=A0A1G4BEU5_9PEZI|nr:uncharacterized protein CORC01_04842 [Colletotrichum orchidophilum]OHE99941.1 hypothetical protein CORC01_04842 [Colletotrichum orchidophilum]
MARDEPILANQTRRLREQRTVDVKGIGVLTFSLRNRLTRLYEALVLLCGLIEACKRPGSGQYRTPSETGEPGSSSRTTLEFFINKLAQICDNRPYGSTVTSLAIIQKPDKMQYIFASNQRSPEDAESSRTVISQLLDNMAVPERFDVRDDDRSPVFRQLLHNILLFHAERVSLYISRLNQRLNQCVENLKATSSQPGDPLLYELEYLQTLTEVMEPLDDNEEVARNSERLVLAANAFRKSPMYESVIERTREGRFDESERWFELQHFIGRLSSYHGAVRAILSGRRRLHPGLFENFEVLWLPSSKPMPNPMDSLHDYIRVEKQQEKRSSKNIIRRMMSESAERSVILEHAETLQVCGLDEHISRQCQKSTFSPIIHCEILILQYLCQEYRGDHHVPFFNDARYIGCSKPTCRLCEYYFNAHNGGIQVRSGHKNVYSNWTIPNIFAAGSAEATERDNLIDKVIAKIREDALRALREKVSDGKRYDSNTYSSQPTHQSLDVLAAPSLDRLAVAVGALSIIVSTDNPHSVDEDTRSICAEVGESDVDEDNFWEGSGLEHSGGVTL